MMYIWVVQNTEVKLKCNILAYFAHSIIPVYMEKISINFDENQVIFRCVPADRIL